MSYLFDASYYINCKLAQLQSAHEIDPQTGKAYTQEGLYRAIADAGLTPQQHYELYGRSEKLNPNPYFNEYEYLEAKARQLNSVGDQPNPAGGPWDAAAVLKAITDAGMTPAGHYEIYGAFERDAEGNFISPSNAFDANAYWSAKLLQLQTEEPEGDWTMEAMLDAFKESGVSPVSHYKLWGADEADASGVPFVQTVPVSQRVPNDPARDGVTGDVAPGNYMAATPPPTDTNAAPAQNPCDVGGLADTGVSPPPVCPESSPPVPGDRDYLPLPSTITPGPGVVILPPSGAGDSVSDHWLVVDPATGTATVVDRDGAVLGQTTVTITENADGGRTVTLPPSSDVPVADLPPLDPDDLPTWITPDPDLPNHFPTPDPTPPPPPAYNGITARAEGATLTLSGPAIDAVEVTLDASGAAVVTDGSASVTVTGNNTGITAVDVSNLTGHDVTIMPKDAAAGPLNVKVTGQTGAQTTTVTGSNDNDGISVISGNVNVNAGTGDDSVSVGAGYAGTVDFGTGDDTLEVSGVIGAATFVGTSSTATMRLKASADLTAATLNDFGAIKFEHNGSATLDINSNPFATITTLTGMTGQEDTLNIHMPTRGGALDLSTKTFTDWTVGEDKTVITTSAAGGDTITLSSAGSDTVNFTVSGTPATDTVNDFTFGATNAGGDVIAFSEAVANLRGTEYEKVAAANSALGASTGFVVYTAAAVADQTAAQSIVEGLTGAAANNVIYFLSSDGTNATLYKATYTSPTTATLQEISTLNGVTTANLGDVVADNLDGFTFDGGPLTATVSDATNTLTLSGAALATVDVTLNASGTARVLVGLAEFNLVGGTNTGITDVDVSGVTGQNVTIAPAALTGPLNVNVTGQAGAQTTTVNGSNGNDSIAVLSGKVDVNAGIGDDIVVVEAGYAGTVELGTGNDTLDVSGVIGAATFTGTNSTATIRLQASASADLTAATLNDFDALAFIHNGAATLDINSDPFSTIDTLTGMTGQDDTLDIHLTTEGGTSELNLSVITTLNTWDGNDTVNVIGSDNADTITLGSAWDATNKLTVTGGKGNDTITLGSGQDTVIFADTAADNGQDTITGFTVRANNDVLDFFGGSTGAVTTNFGTAIDMTSGNATAITNNEVVRVTNAAGTLTNNEITATASQTNHLTVADNATAVALVATGTSVGTFNVYEITDTDASGAQNYQVTLMGIVTLATGQTFGELVAGNVA